MMMDVVFERGSGGREREREGGDKREIGESDYVAGKT